MNTLYGSILNNHPFSSNFTFKIKSQFHRISFFTQNSSSKMGCLSVIFYLSCELTQTIQQQSSSSSSTPCSGLYCETSTACSLGLPDLTVILLPPSFDGVLNGPSLRDPLPLCHTVPSQAGFSLAQSRWQIVIIISQSPKLSGVRAVWSLSLNVPSERH